LLVKTVAKRDIIVVGASAGGMEALQRVVAGLPADLPAAMFVVWHLPPGLRRSVLPQVLSRAGKLPALEAEDGMRIRPGRIYVAASDHHLLLDRGVMRVTKGPKENRFRPAIDPLFRSAAYAYGPRTIGVVLTGALDDGTSGLWTVKLRGGTAIVQDPAEAMHASMPLSALENVSVDLTLRLDEIGPALARLAREDAPVMPALAPATESLLEKEVRIAEEANALEEGFMKHGSLSPFTCPECHGVLTKLQDGKIERYRCHTGHAYSGATLLSEANEQVEARLWDAARALDESVMLLNRLGEDQATRGDATTADEYFSKAREALERGRQVREIATSPEGLTPENLKAA
jgi:two-component system chemotaxis response regulator CheB